MRASNARSRWVSWRCWLELVRAGIVRNRAKRPYKPSAIRAYEAALRLRVLPEFGRVKLSAITTDDLQRFVCKLDSEGLNASQIGVSPLPLRAIYKHHRRKIPVNPTAALEMPSVERAHRRIASPAECARLLAALPESDRPVWAVAMYAGLRRGELMALRVEDIDLATGVIYVRQGWDTKEGVIPTKNRGERKVPIAAVLRDYLDEHLLRLEWTEGFVFGVSPVSPFTPTRLRERANAAWRSAGLDRLMLHEARHTFASLMIAAGVNAKALSTYMGHANIGITLDLYGHLMPGNENEAAALLDAYLSRASEDAARASLAPVVS